MTGLRFDRLAFRGGSRINQIGSLDDVVCFFQLVEKYAAASLNKVEQFIILDRLYKRYLRIGEIPDAIRAMKKVQDCFSRIPKTDVNWNIIGANRNGSALKMGSNMVEGVVIHFFEDFSECARSAVSCYNDDIHPFFRPVIICRSDFGSLDREDRRPFEEYDTLDGPPFWLAGA